MPESSSKAYEMMVKSLLATTLRTRGVTRFKAYHLKEYVGKSGHRHPIDVSFEVEWGILPPAYLFVECKEYARKVGVEEVMEFAYRLRDTGAGHGLLVTTNGFQEGAVSMARAEKIGLMVAAKGRIVRRWLGERENHYEFWIHRFSLEVNTETRSLQLIGERIVATNATYGVTRWDAEASAPSGEPEIAFLLPEEEWLLQYDTPDAVKDEAQHPGRFGRRLERDWNPEEADHANRISSVIL
jgi:hypothetical protein